MGNEGKGAGIKSIIGRYKILRDVNNGIGNGVAKELTCTTYGYDLRGG